MERETLPGPGILQPLDSPALVLGEGEDARGWKGSCGWSTGLSYLGSHCCLHRMCSPGCGPDTLPAAALEALAGHECASASCPQTPKGEEPRALTTSEQRAGARGPHAVGSPARNRAREVWAPLLPLLSLQNEVLQETTPVSCSARVNQ